MPLWLLIAIGAGVFLLIVAWLRPRGDSRSRCRHCGAALPGEAEVRCSACGEQS
jgi:hypothetical protein